MDFVRSYFGKNEPLTRWTLFFQISTDLEKKWGQKCSTGQRFICTEVTSYKIHTLGKINYKEKFHEKSAPLSYRSGASVLVLEAPVKGQLISKCPFGFIVWTKIPTKLFLDFCPEFFCSFLGASWKLFGLPGDLVCNIINKEACRKPQKASRKPPGRYKKFQGRNSEIISLVILSKRWNQRDILKLTDL